MDETMTFAKFELIGCDGWVFTFHLPLIYFLSGGYPLVNFFIFIFPFSFLATYGIK